MDLAKNTDPKNLQIKRVAIDALYSIGIHCQSKIAVHKQEILTILDVCRTDKN